MQKAEGRRQKQGNFLSTAFTVRYAWLLIFLLWISIFSMACRLLGMSELGRHTERGLIDVLFSKTRFEFSNQFFTEADVVFHKGVAYRQPAALDDWFVKMRKETAPSGHAHLHEEGVLEIMPWLYFATQADPGNVEAYTVAAFWLAGEGGRPDLAEQVLNEALRNNPSDYRVYLEKGKLALKSGAYLKATRLLTASLSCYPKTPYDEKEQMRIDLAEILTYLGLLYEIQGNCGNALNCYREVVKMYPGRLQMKERLKELETKGIAATPPEELAKVLVRQHRHVCTMEENEHANSPFPISK
jgi:tetratricopeptide (TPR) repeat protein